MPVFERHRSRVDVAVGNSCSTHKIQENTLRGGQTGRTVQGRRIHARAVGSIDRSVNLNRALWVLAEEMRKVKR